MYIESGKVKFYPSSYRQYQDGGETKNINPESELNTEYNITSHIAKLLKKSKGSFIVNYVENNNLEFYLGGYYIHISSPKDILDAFPNATQIWANMKVAPFTPTDNTKGFSELYEVVDYEDSGKNIDDINNNVVSFKGVAFLDTKDSNATFSLQLFTRKDTSSSWYTHTSSEYILDTSEIYNENGDTNILSEFYSLKINTDDLYAELGKMNYATINSNLEVLGDALFEQQVEFMGDLVPTSGTQINIGQSGNEIANIYANNLTATKINLKSQIIPDGTVTLGLANNPITNIYATNIYGINLKDVNEIDGGLNSITLKSDIVPDGQVDLGGSTSKFNQIYANETISDILDTNSLKVNDINSGSSFISLYKPILPTSTGTISLGNNNLKFGGIYATTFYGSLSGNASTATKLNKTGSVGNQTGAVYFNNGVPVATDYNSANFNAIKNLHNFSFTSLPQVGSSSNPMDITVGGGYANNCLIFVTIDFGSYTDTVPFIRKQLDDYSYNNCNSPSYMFRLSFADTEASTIPYFKTTVTLQYKNTGAWSKAPFNIINIFALQFPNITTTN